MLRALRDTYHRLRGRGWGLQTEQGVEKEGAKVEHVSLIGSLHSGAEWACV